MQQDAKMEDTHTWRCSRVWIKRIDKMHKRVATQLYEILERTKEIPSWMMYGKTVLFQTHSVSVKNFRPITCLQFIWKLLLCIISEDILLLFIWEDYWRKAWRSENFFWIQMSWIYVRLRSIEATSKGIACHHWSLLFP